MSDPNQHPQTNGHEHGAPTGPVTHSISEAIEKAAYNEAGIAMTPVASYEIGGQAVDSLLVSMRPGVAVPAHLHEEGGEAQRAITPVRGVFGEPQKNGDGGYELTPEGRVKFEVTDNRIYTPDEITAIRPGLVHGFGNPSRTENAHIMFDLPHTHTTGEDKLVATEVAALAEALPDEEYELHAGEQPLAVVTRKIGHIAHDHTPPAS